MNKKILLSVAASMLLTTSAFSLGEVTTSPGHANIATESFQQNGLDIIDLNTFRYTPAFNRPGGSISDPLISIDVTNLELPLHIDIVAGVETLDIGYDEVGKGLTILELSQLTGVDLETTVVDQFMLEETFIEDVDTAGSVADFDQLNVENGRVYFQYDGASGDEVKNGHTYQISGKNPDGDDFSFPFKYRVVSATATEVTQQEIGVELFSNTLDDNVIDSDTYSPITGLVPQFKVACVRKFDGLINFENDRVTFVNPAHGERLVYAEEDSSGNTGSNVASKIENDSVINNDRMVFTIWNARTSENDNTRWMGGHLSEFRFAASNADNDFTFDTGEWNIDVDIFDGATAGNLDTLLAPTKTYNLVDAAYLEHDPAGRDPGIAFDALTNIFTITHGEDEIEPGLTTYEVNFQKEAGFNTPIRPVSFTSVAVDLEGGLAANDHRDRAAGDGILEESVLGAQPVTFLPAGHDIDAAGSHWVINNVDDNTTVIVPQIEAPTLNQDIGEWMDHAYIAQIAGAADGAVVQSKVFIVNRSCAPATPTFKLIKDGQVSVYKANAAIPVDSQIVARVANIKTENGYTLVSGPSQAATTGVFAVEVMLSGIAEDFYVYAQAFNVNVGNFKDLPVYNTSNRD